MFFQHENRFRYKFFDIVQFSRSCLSTSAADSLNILPDFVLNVKHFFQKFLNFLEELVELRTFSSVFVEICLSDVRLTVMYFSTSPDKKQALFLTFFKKIQFSYSSSNFARISLRSLRSRREICTWVVCRIFAVSLWVRLA